MDSRVENPQTGRRISARYPADGWMMSGWNQFLSLLVGYPSSLLRILLIHDQELLRLQFVPSNFVLVKYSIGLSVSGLGRGLGRRWRGGWGGCCRECGGRRAAFSLLSSSKHTPRRSKASPDMYNPFGPPDTFKTAEDSFKKTCSVLFGRRRKRKHKSRVIFFDKTCNWLWFGYNWVRRRA